MKFQLLSSTVDQSRAILLLPGLDEALLQGVEFRVDPDRGVMDVYLYEKGFNDDEDVEGHRVPVPITDRTAPIIRTLRELVVLNPQSDSYLELPEEEQHQLLEQSDWINSPDESEGEESSSSSKNSVRREDETDRA